MSSRSFCVICESSSAAGRPGFFETADCSGAVHGKLSASPTGSWCGGRWGRSWFCSASDNIEHMQTRGDDRDRGDKKSKLPPTPRGEHRVGRNVLGAFHSLRGRFKGPGNIQREYKAKRQDHHNSRHHRETFFTA